MLDLDTVKFFFSENTNSAEIFDVFVNYMQGSITARKDKVS